MAESFPNFSEYLSQIKLPEIDKALYDLAPARDHRMADYQYEILCKYIEAFQNTLDNNHEVGVQLASFGQSVTMQVTGIGFHNPSIITFNGYVNGQRSKLIQHVNQLSFLLLACPKEDPVSPPRRIGFSMTN